MQVRILLVTKMRNKKVASCQQGWNTHSARLLLQRPLPSSCFVCFVNRFLVLSDQLRCSLLLCTLLVTQALLRVWIPGVHLHTFSGCCFKRQSIM